VAKHYYSEYGLGSQSGADPLNATQGIPSQLIEGDEYTEVRYETEAESVDVDSSL
jgi:hypothetical protein